MQTSHRSETELKRLYKNKVFFRRYCFITGLIHIVFALLSGIHETNRLEGHLFQAVAVLSLLPCMLSLVSYLHTIEFIKDMELKQTVDIRQIRRNHDNNRKKLQRGV